MVLRYLVPALVSATLVFATLAGGVGHAANYKTLRALQAPPPVTVAPLPPGTNPQPVKLSRVVLQPPEGEGWALVYLSLAVSTPDFPGRNDTIVPWESGREDADTAGFARVFDQELRAAGFKSGGATSLFDDNTSADLQVGVLIDDIKGRFCMDCPHVLQREKVAAVVTMNARWEVYSTVRSGVVARVTTNTGAVWRERNGDSAAPVMYAAFRENVRALLNSDEFRKAVGNAPSLGAVPPALSPLGYTPSPPARRTIASAGDSVAAIFAGGAMGSGFLVGSEGYLLTNHHVVGDVKYVKVRWSDGTEAVGEVIRLDRRRDVALIKAAHGLRKPLALSRAEAAPGDNVFLIGTPLDSRLQGTVTKGIVSAKRKLDGLDFIQSDVVSNKGNSGGPLLDEGGAVLGISVAGYDIGGAQSGLNLFIPIAEALRALALQPVG